MNNQTENIEVPKLDKDASELPKLIWDEYKYRHELCWNLIFKITFVTASLSIIPYLNNNIIHEAKRILFFTPLIGIGVAMIGGFRLYRELQLLDKIRNLHRIYQKRTFDELYNKLFQEDLHNPKGSSFTSYVSAYLIILTFLALLNFIILLFFFYFTCP